MPRLKSAKRARERAMRKRRALTRWALCSASLVVTLSYAQETGWRVDPSLLVRETFTDNLRLAPKGSEESEFITEVVPRLRITGSGPRLRANIDYSPSLLLFANNAAARVRHSLTALATAEVVENFLFLEGVGRVFQSGASAYGPAPSDTVNLSSNIVETRTFGLNPYVRGRIGGDTTYTLRNNNLWTSSNGDNLVDAYARAYLAHIENTVQVLGWSGDYERREIRFEGSPALTNQLYRARLHVRPDPSLMMYAGAGQEQNNFFLDNRSSSIYGGGFNWRPMERAGATANWEHRFFGSAYSANLNYRGQSIAWMAGVSRDLSNFALESLRTPAGDTTALLDAALIGRYPDPNDRRNAIDQLIRQAGLPSNLTVSQGIYARRLFTINRAETSLVVSGVRNTLAATIFRTQTRFFGDENFVPLATELGLRNDFDARGGALSFTHQFTPLLSGNLFYGRTRTTAQTPPNQSATQDLVRAQVSQALNSKTAVFGGVRHVIYKADGTGFSTFRENAAYVGVEHRF